MGAGSQSHDRSDDQEKCGRKPRLFSLEEHKMRRLIALEISSSLEACHHAHRRLPCMVTG